MLMHLENILAAGANAGRPASSLNDVLTAYGVPMPPHKKGTETMTTGETIYALCSSALHDFN